MLFLFFISFFLRFEHVSELKGCAGEEEVESRVEETVRSTERSHRGDRSPSLIAHDREITGEEEELVDRGA